MYWDPVGQGGMKNTSPPSGNTARQLNCALLPAPTLGRRAPEGVHPQAPSDPHPILTAPQELLLSQPTSVRVWIGELAAVCFPASPPAPFHTMLVAMRPHHARVGSLTCPGRAEGPAGPVGPASSPTAHPVGSCLGAGEKEIPACTSWGGSCPALPCPPNLRISIWPQFLSELRWLISRESRKDLKAAGHLVPSQPLWAVQPAGKSLALNADKPPAPWLSRL